MPAAAGQTKAIAAPAAKYLPPAPTQEPRTLQHPSPHSTHREGGPQLGQLHPGGQQLRLQLAFGSGQDRVQRPCRCLISTRPVGGEEARHGSRLAHAVLRRRGEGEAGEAPDGREPDGHRVWRAAGTLPWASYHDQPLQWRTWQKQPPHQSPHLHGVGQLLRLRGLTGKRGAGGLQAPARRLDPGRHAGRGATLHLPATERGKYGVWVFGVRHGTKDRVSLSPPFLRISAPPHPAGRERLSPSAPS